MGLRFRRSLRLAPGLRLNFSGSGMSLTTGPRGASLNFGARGTYLNAGLPGTGLYLRERLDGNASTGRSPAAPAAPTPAPVNVTVRVRVKDDGTVHFEDQNGNQVSDAVERETIRQRGEDIRKMMQAQVDEINEQVEALGNIHLHTPNPLQRPSYEAKAFDLEPPVPPSPQKPGFFVGLFASKRRRIAEDNAIAEQIHLIALKEWQRKKDAFEAAEAAHRALVESGIYRDVSAMETFLEQNLHSIVWPRETHASFELRKDGKQVLFDVDLPEIEDLPKQIATTPARGYQFGYTQLSDTQLQRVYMRLVHGIGFRIIGEAFASLPLLEEVVFSGYSQRPDPGTGNLRNDYLYSVRVWRADWARINFANLAAIDVVEALTRFELRREMTATGVFKPVHPFSD
jgi:hypothetical protein